MFVRIFSIVFLSGFFIFGLSCNKPKESDPSGTVLDRHTLDRRINETTVDSLLREVYVPIYSDIYNQTRDSRTLLTATLSIRNNQHSR